VVVPELASRGKARAGGRRIRYWCAGEDVVDVGRAANVEKVETAGRAEVRRGAVHFRRSWAR
jgi:hypothetical protein